MKQDFFPSLSWPLLWNTFKVDQTLLYVGWPDSDSGTKVLDDCKKKILFIFHVQNLTLFTISQKIKFSKSIIEHLEMLKYVKSKRNKRVFLVFLFPINWWPLAKLYNLKDLFQQSFQFSILWTKKSVQSSVNKVYHFWPCFKTIEQRWSNSF